MRKFLPALFSAMLAASFSTLAAAQTQTDKAQARPDTNAGTSAAAQSRAAGGATDDMNKENGKKSAKKPATKSKAKAKHSKAAGGATASREPSTNSSPSQTTGAPGHANQGSVHNDETKK